MPKTFPSYTIMTHSLWPCTVAMCYVFPQLLHYNVTWFMALYCGYMLCFPVYGLVLQL